MPFQLEFAKGNGDLYSQVGKEEIKQLKTELEITRQELVDYDLIEADVV